MCLIAADDSAVGKGVRFNNAKKTVFYQTQSCLRLLKNLE